MMRLGHQICPSNKNRNDHLKPIIPGAGSRNASGSIFLRRTSYGYGRRQSCGVVYCQKKGVLKAVEPSVMPEIKTCHGIGILGFMQGKNYFVTGATGFLGKAFVEKILRTVPDVGKIFLLIRANTKEAAEERINNEIINSDLFERLKQIHGESYETFVRSKLVPVVGDINEDGLGMNAATAELLAEEADVIVSSAASTTMDERYDSALNVNTKGPARLLKFAKTCKNLSLFLQFSTAYVGRECQGTVAETPYYAGTKNINLQNSATCVPTLDIAAEYELASKMAELVDQKELPSKMKELAEARAKMFGWPNSYSFTKAMGEMVISNFSADLDFPVVIMRPSIIESTYSEPFPGWIQGNRMLDPIVLGYGKGQLPGYLFDPQGILDVIPVDMVVNASMAAIAKHGMAAKPEMNIYHITSSSANPLITDQLRDFLYRHFTSYPIKDSKGEEIKVTEMEFFSSVNDFSSFISRKVSKQVGQDKIAKKITEYLVDLAKVYKPYTFSNARFDNTNIKKLMEEMSVEEQRMFGHDVGTINWEHYFINVHFPGLKRHVLKGRFSTC